VGSIYPLWRAIFSYGNKKCKQCGFRNVLNQAAWSKRSKITMYSTSLIIIILAIVISDGVGLLFFPLGYLANLFSISNGSFEKKECIEKESV